MAEIVIATTDSFLYTTLEAEFGALGVGGAWAVHGVEALEMCAAPSVIGVAIDASIEMYTLWELCHFLRSDPEVPDGFPIFIISDEDLSSRKLENYSIAEVLPRSHDTALMRELLYQHLDLAAL